MPRTFHHFTALLWLPSIMREGITLGEIPLGGPYENNPQLPNLTSESDPRKQGCWCPLSSPIDKSRVRLSVELEQQGYVTFKTIRQRYNLSNSWVKQLAPNSEHFSWYFSVESVPVKKISKVELAISKQFEYQPLEAKQLEQVLRDVDHEFDAAIEFEPATGMVALKQESTWLFDGRAFQNSSGCYPAGLNCNYPLPDR